MWSGKTRDSCPGEEMMASRRVQWPGLPASAQHVRPRTRSSLRPATSSLQPPLTNALQQIRRLSPGGGALGTSASHRSRLLSRWRHCQRLTFIVVSPTFTIMLYTSWTLNISFLVLYVNHTLGSNYNEIHPKIVIVRFKNSYWFKT